MLNACNEPEILEILMIAKTIINILCIFAPIIVIVNSMIDVAKATVGKGMDEVTANIKHIVPRIVAMSMVFLVPSFLQLTINMVDDYSKFATCLNMADEDGIQIAYVNAANGILSQKTEDYNNNDYSRLIVIISKIKDKNQKEALSVGAVSMKEILDEKRKQNEIIKAPIGSGGFIYPLSGRGVSPEPTGGSRYGMRKHPITGEYKMHTGIDIGCQANTPLLAAKAGTVKTSTYSAGGYGEYIVIDHHDSTSTLYAHGIRNSRRVNVGQSVAQGQVIMLCGSTGMSTGNHLHFEVRVNNKHTDPMPYLR